MTVANFHSSLASMKGSLGNDSFTKLLLHMNGANASTTFTDSNAGGSIKTFTASGNAQLSTSSPPLGSAFGTFDGTGDYIRCPDHADFTLGSGDWTFDFRFNINTSGNGTFRYIFGQSNSSANGGVSVLCRLSDTNQLQLLWTTNGSSFNTKTGSAVMTTSGWRHGGIVRTGNVCKFFIDGSPDGSDTAMTGSIHNSSNSFGVGCGGEINSNTWYGGLDEFRLSNIARWTGAFTPQTSEYA